jgi:hypothetical protein
MAKAADGPDYAKYADKPATDLQVRFGEWIQDKVGIEFGTKKELEAFNEGVRLATALRMPFQRSDENQSVLEKRRGGEEEEAPARPAKKATKKARRAAAEEEAPAKPAKKAAKKAARRAAPASDEPEQSTRPQRRPARRRPAAAAAEASF